MKNSHQKAKDNNEVEKNVKKHKLENEQLIRSTGCPKVIAVWSQSGSTARREKNQASGMKNNQKDDKMANENKCREEAKAGL